MCVKEGRKGRAEGREGSTRVERGGGESRIENRYRGGRRVERRQYWADFYTRLAEGLWLLIGQGLGRLDTVKSSQVWMCNCFIV